MAICVRSEKTTKLLQMSVINLPSLTMTESRTATLGTFQYWSFFWTMWICYNTMRRREESKNPKSNTTSRSAIIIILYIDCDPIQLSESCWSDSSWLVATAWPDIHDPCRSLSFPLSHTRGPTTWPLQVLRCWSLSHIPSTICGGRNHQGWPKDRRARGCLCAFGQHVSTKDIK